MAPAFDQRAGDRGPERAGPAGHDHMAIGEIHGLLLAPVMLSDIIADRRP